MIHERKIGDFNLPIVEGENFCVHELIVAHVVNLDPALMISLEVLDHILLAVTKEFKESAAR